MSPDYSLIWPDKHSHTYVTPQFFNWLLHIGWVSENGRVVDPEKVKWAMEGPTTKPEPQRSTTGDPRFHALLKKIGDLHDAKQADYGTEGDPFANVRASEAFGVPAWVGTVIRANDKMKRLQTFAKAKMLKNESVEDSLMDLAVYALIALILFEEQK